MLHENIFDKKYKKNAKIMWSGLIMQFHFWVFLSFLIITKSKSQKCLFKMWILSENTKVCL